MSDDTKPITDQPKLAAPGAGLPWLELQIARFGFGWMSRRTSREQASALLAKQRDAILKLVQPCDAQSGTHRILIDRLRGIEDSSRFWSVFMTLDHLRIVNRVIAETIRLLGRDKIPAWKASTANVKPDPQATIDVVGDFDASCRLVERCAERLPNLKTALRSNHPWFGSMDAAQWHLLAGVHLRLHHRQIELILKKIP